MPPTAVSRRRNTASPAPAVTINVEGPQGDAPAAESAAPAEIRDDRPSLWEFLAAIPDNEWKDYNVSLYRRFPRVTMSTGKGGGYLSQFSQPFGIEDIKAHYGGGVFEAMVMKGGKLKGGGTWTIEIEGPPKYDLTRERPEGSAALVQTSANSVEVGVLQSFANNLMEEVRRQRDVAPAGSSAAADAALEMISKANERAMEIVVKQTQPASSPNDILDAASKLIELTRGNSANNSGNGGLADKLLERMLDRMFAPPPAPPPPPNPVEQIKPVIELVNAIRGGSEGGLMVGATGGRSDWKTILAEKAVDNLPELIKVLQGVFEARVKEAENLRKREETRAQNIAAVRGMQQQPGVTPAPAPAIPPVPGTPAPAPTGLSVVPIEGEAPAPAAVAVDPGQPQPVGLAQTEAAAIVDAFVKSRVRDLIAEAVDIEMLVDFIDGANPAIGAMLTQANETQLREFLGSDPILAPVLQLPHFNRYLADLMDYLAQAVEDEPATDKTAEPAKIN